MPDLRQALKDFVATSNSGKYSDEKILLSKFPELQSYDINVLRDFVATSNSGKYSTEDEVFSKFPEFQLGQEVKKKSAESVPSSTVLPSEDGQLVSPKPTETVAVGPMGITGLQRTAEYKPKQQVYPVQTKPIEPVVAKKIIDETPKETPYFTGKFGVALQAIDTFSPFGIGDFIDDMGRAIDAGHRQGAVVSPANKLMVSGKYSSPEAIKKFVTASKAMQNLGPSDEMVNYQKIYEEEGKGIFGVLKGLAKNPGAIPELIMSSYTAMVNPTSLASAGTVVGGAALGGAVLGEGVGAIPAVIGSAPYAMAAAGTTLETGLTFSELLQDKLTQRGLDFTEENVKKILEDKNALSEIRVKSVARGATIGIIDAMTGRLAGKVGAKLIGNTVASKVKAGLASAAIESAGGSGGELAGRIVAGQPLDVSEIALEGISESPSAVIDIASEVMSKPVYKVNGEHRTEADIQEIIKFGTPEDISRMNFDIKNDNKGYKEKIQDIVVTSSIKEQVRESNPNLSEEQLDEVTNLEKELRKFEGNTTQSGKDRAAAIRSQIKTIQDAVQEQATSEVPVQSGAGVSETLEEGKPQAEPQVTPTEGQVQEEVKKKSLPEGVTIEEAITEDGEIDYEAEDELRKIAKGRNLGITSDRQVAYVAKDSDGNIIGGAFTSYDGDKYTFDVVVAEDQEGTGIGSKLLDAVSNIPFDIKDQNPNATVEVDVVNPVMQKMLEARGFEVKETLGEGRVLMQPAVSSKTPEEVAIGEYNPTEEVKNKDMGVLNEVLTKKKVQPEAEPDITDFGDTVVFEYSDLNAEGDSVTRLTFNKNKNGEIVGRGVKVEKGVGRIKQTKLFEDFVNSQTQATQEVAPVIEEVAPILTRDELPDYQESTQTEVTKKILDYFAEVLGIPKFTDNGKARQTYSSSLSSIWLDNARLLPMQVRAKLNYPKKAFDIITKYKKELDKQAKAAKTAPVVEEAAPVEEVEQYVPITEDKLSHSRFTRDNATNYEEDERETESGRMLTYLSSITVGVEDENGDTVGGLTKLTDEYGDVTWNVSDEDGIELSEDGYGTKEEAKKALVDKINKLKKKEFDKEVKKKAKAAEKVATKKPAPAPEEGPTAEELASIDAMLDLDVEDEDNMLNVLNALDRVDSAITKRLRGNANDALLAIPLSTVQLVVKTLKTLVKGGMMLRDAIKKVAADNNLSQDSVKDILNIAPIQDGFNELMNKVSAMIQRQTSRGTEQKRMISNIDTLVRNSEVYQNANDAQKKILEREARAQAGVRERRAPSIGRILGVLKDINNVSRKDKLKIISQIRQLSKDAANSLAKEIKELTTQGKITVNQAANIVSRFGKVNMLSEISVSKFVDYMTKVFNDAEYASKLGTAKSLKKDIKKLSKIKDKNANLRDLGQKFSEIDPSMVENIDAYNEMASKIKEAIKGSTIRGQKVALADMVNINEASEYISKTLEAQDKAMREEKAAEIQSLMGIDVSELSYDDMMSLLESKEPITKYNEGIIRSTINKAFNVFSSLIKETIATGKDLFTGEDVEFTKSQKDVVKRFMDMDLSLLSPKEALKAVDALSNFLQNKSTAKMETVVSEYTALKGAQELVDKGIKAEPLKKYWSPSLGRFLGEQFTNLNVLFEKMFKGFTRGGEVMDKMGLTELINKKSFGQSKSNNIVERYVEQFYKKQANGEAFNSEYNAIERGLAAFMTRSVIGTQVEMNKEFERRRGLIEESIQVLSEGNDKEKAKSEIYQKAYDKIVKNSKNIEDISGKVDKTNLEAIDFWRNEWANKYEQLSDVSLNVYNKVLDKDLNYTPDRFVKLSSDTGVVELNNEDSAFHTNNGTLYQTETGVLMTATRPESLPKDPKSGDTNRYIDLSFDSANSNAMYDALIDINTAAPIRQVEAFLNSSNFKKIVPNADDAKILKNRIKLYVGNIRNKNPYSNDELSNAVKGLNKIAAIGVGQALGGITQPIKQVIPVAMNTVINAGGLDIGSIFDADKMKFLMDSGYAIANRGVESQAQIESINKLIDQASKSKGEKALKLIEEANKKWLEIFLVKPDVYIAKASWMTYYEQALNKQGIDTKNIDYSKHELNKDAANYAQRMVDRQQNVSDTDLAGKMFTNKESSNQLLVKTLMPFASFRMNQSARLGADLATLNSSTATAEDKKIAAKSVAGFGVEMVTFRLIGIATSILLGSLAKKIMGRDEDDEDKKKRIDGIIKGAKTGTFTDIFSPLPIADKLIQAGGSAILDEVEKATNIPVSIFGSTKQDFLQNAGLFGIAADRANQLWDLSKLATTGKYTDDFGKEKTISDKDKDGLKMLIAPAIMTNLGLAPSEVNTVVRYAIKDSKKKSTSGSDVEAKTERAESRAESIDQKTEALEKVKEKATDPDLIDAIDEKLGELDATTEEKKLIKEQNKEERELKKELLTDPDTGEEYDNESELKKYNKNLWNENFGPNSDWYQSHKYDKEVEKQMNKEIRKMEDEEQGYTAPIKQRKSNRNSDGSLKRTYGKTKRSY